MGRVAVLQIVKAAAIALVNTLVGILAFALVLKLTTFSFVAVKAVNQFIKATSLFIGCFVSIRGKGGWIKGVFSGVVYIALTHAAFAIISGGTGGGSVFIDVLFGAVAGAICGIVAVNAKRVER